MVNFCKLYFFFSNQLDLILDASLGKMGMLAMRILTSSGKIYLDYVIHKVAEENEARKIRFAKANFFQE